MSDSLIAIFSNRLRFADSQIAQKDARIAELEGALRCLSRLPDEWKANQRHKICFGVASFCAEQLRAALAKIRSGA
jgi:hypothetical protein